ncbi:MAG: alkanesulfonate monooxygenase SsuD [Candidatus Poriferisodalaceae bacterium]|jgi:alkanesulfonate monooxygenase SsuD/methylene tetrahydromethanopterin reductase-like flavin-dependent oxidoreductase (luciferase family)
MRIGVSLSSTYQVTDHREGARSMIDRASAAWAAGLDHLTIGDHHNRPVPYYQNTPMLGRLLAEWGERPAGCLFLVPLWNPVLMAEHIGTLASIHSGRFIVQTGLGDGEAQFGAMGANPRTRPSDFIEGVRMVKALLVGETVNSERFGLTDASIAPRPPEPVEWWIGASADVAIDRAATMSGSWYASPGLALAEAEAKVTRFHQALAANDREPGQLVMRQDVLVAETDEQAQQLAEPVLASGYRGMPADRLAIGSVESVAARFRQFADIGFTHISARQISVPQQAALTSIGLLGEINAAC